jgi:hypothetical protein
MAEFNVESAKPLASAKEPPAPLRRNGHAVNGNGHDEPRTLASRFKPFVVGSIIGAAVGFFAGAHM